MEIRSGGSELLTKPYRGYTSRINLGDATLLASLHTIAQGKHAIVIDNNPTATGQILNELDSGVPVFNFLAALPEQRQMYASIDRKVMHDSQRYGQLQMIYRDAWEAAKDNLSLLTCVNADINTLSTEPSFTPIADEITYYYPSPVYGPRFKALELASKLLKPEGIFTIATENAEVAESFSQLAKPFVTQSGFTLREDSIFLSAYDVAWGQDGHYLVEIKNKGGKLPEHILSIKKGVLFKALSLLGFMP